jgi:hypothetical protein
MHDGFEGYEDYDRYEEQDYHDMDPEDYGMSFDEIEFKQIDDKTIYSGVFDLYMTDKEPFYDNLHPEFKGHQTKPIFILVAKESSKPLRYEDGTLNIEGIVSSFDTIVAARLDTEEDRIVLDMETEDQVEWTKCLFHDYSDYLGININDACEIYRTQIKGRY